MARIYPDILRSIENILLIRLNRIPTVLTVLPDTGGKTLSMYRFGDLQK